MAEECFTKFAHEVVVALQNSDFRCNNLYENTSNMVIGSGITSIMSTLVNLMEVSCHSKNLYRCAIEATVTVYDNNDNKVAELAMFEKKNHSNSNDTSETTLPVQSHELFGTHQASISEKEKCTVEQDPRKIHVSAGAEGTGKCSNDLLKVNAEKCMWYLLDGLGLTRHALPNEPLGFIQMKKACLDEPMKDVYEAIRHERNMEKRMTYKSLIPKEFQDLNLKFPLLSRGYTRNSSLGQEFENINMANLSKNTRTKKNVMIGAMSLLLQFPNSGEGKRCEEALSAYGEEGLLSSKGCERYMKGMKITGANCPCRSIPSTPAILCNDSNDLIGEVQVYATLDDLYGCYIPSDFVVVRFNSIVSSNALKTLKSVGVELNPFGSDLPLDDYTIRATYAKNFLVWKKENLARVSVRGNNNIIFGSAIVTADICLSGKNIVESANSKIVTLTDLKLDESIQIELEKEKDESEEGISMYPYFEWYQTMPLLKESRRKHFKDGFVPKSLLGMIHTNCRAFAWPAKDISPAI